MPVVCIYANGKPECIDAEIRECVEVIVEMTGVSVDQAYAFMGEAFFINAPLSIIGPYDLFIDWGMSENPPCVRMEYDPAQQPDDDDDI